MPRKAAYNILWQVEYNDAFSHLAIDDELSKRSLKSNDRNLATQLVYGTLTWRRSIDRIISSHLDQSIDSLDEEILLQLRLGIYQIVFLDKIPPHAAVNEAVEATKSLLHRGAANLVNAVLRSVLREESVQWWEDKNRKHSPAKYLGQRYSLPNWLANRLLQMLEIDGAERWASAFNQKPPLYLRALRANDSTSESLKSVPGIPDAYKTSSLTPALREQIQGGHLSVQDLGSQLVGWLPHIEPGDQVMDACAGLGGKTLHLADRVGEDGRVVALDPQEVKLEKLVESAKRTGLADRIETHAITLESFVDKTTEDFDSVVIDAPCTAVGTIRRHPEIRWRRSESDLHRLTQTQGELLEAGESVVAPDGDFVFAVCSFLAEEGPKQFDAFFATGSGWQLVEPGFDEITWDEYLDEDGYLSINPADHATDAFFGGRLKR